MSTSLYVNSPGGMTFAVRRSPGKSLGFNVTTKFAIPRSAQMQNGLSLGSGEISTEERTLTSSARSRIRLTTRPIRFARTPSRLKTCTQRDVFGYAPYDVSFSVKHPLFEGVPAGSLPLARKQRCYP